ncbi:MAG: YdcF family protein [Burkholderiales bacterium]|nr:YdcF family protein [Burkholderiales bacterium]
MGIAALALGAVVAADLVAAHWYHARMSAAYSVVPAAGADAAIVLFSAYAPDGSIDAETRRRLDHATRLFGTGVVRAVLCSGGHRRSADGAELMARYLEERGVPGASVFSESGSYDTQTNVERSAAVARARGWRSVVFVSSPVHLARVHALAAASGLNATYSAYHAGTVEPGPRWSERISQVHHEWVAWAAWSLLPPARYRDWVARYRGRAAP